MKSFSGLRFRHLTTAGTILILAAIVPRQVSAVPVSFTIDPARSSYHIVNVTNDPSPPAPLADSTILGVPVIPQVTGGDTDALTGTINADDVSNILTFSGTSSIALAANPAGPFVPATNPGTDNFGIVTNGATALGVPISVAIRNWALTIQSGTASNGVSPSAGSIVLAATAGYQQNSATGQSSLTAVGPGPDVSTAAISLTTSGGIETLVIPVSRLPVSGTPGQIYFSATIVATRSVPEPSCIALAAGAALGLAVAQRKRGRIYFAGRRPLFGRPAAQPTAPGGV